MKCCMLLMEMRSEQLALYVDLSDPIKALLLCK
jgi:hypothetical protein